MRKIVLLLLTTILLTADSDDRWALGDYFKRKKGVEPVKNELYQEECGSCHFAYQPGLLPKRSWKKMMKISELENHFGDDAYLEEDYRVEIENFLVKNSADDSWYKRSRKIMASIREDEAPLRISETRYFERKHDEIPKRLVKQKEVRSFSHCSKCHESADKGIYDDDSVNIPNYGRWDD